MQPQQHHYGPLEGRSLRLLVTPIFFDDEFATTGTEGLDGVKVDNCKHQKIVSLSFLSYLGSRRIQTLENNFCLLPKQLGEKVATLQCSCIQSGSQCPHVINLACYDGHTCLSHPGFGSQIASVLRTTVPVTGLRSSTSPTKSKAIPKFFPSVFHDVHSRMSAKRILASVRSWATRLTFPV